MADIVLRVGGFSAQGARSNNEDRFVVDQDQSLFLVADGMGGQLLGEQASGLAAEIIPRVVQARLAANEDATTAVREALAEANAAIIDAGRDQPEGRRMGTTAVLALKNADRVYVAGLGDSRAYLLRDSQVEQLTVDHSVAEALRACGALTAEEARHSPYQHVLHKFLGCANMLEEAEVKPFTPKVGDCLLLATDGLTNHVDHHELLRGAGFYTEPQALAEHLVNTALQQGSRDNVTCIVVMFDNP